MDFESINTDELVSLDNVTVEFIGCGIPFYEGSVKFGVLDDGHKYLLLNSEEHRRLCIDIFMEQVPLAAVINVAVTTPNHCPSRGVVVNANVPFAVGKRVEPVVWIRLL